MPRPQDLTRASRARPCTFILPDGSEITIRPPGVDQVIACLALDPAPGERETPLQELKRARDQFRHLAGPASADLTRVLDGFQLAQMTDALYASFLGLDAEKFAAWQALVQAEKAALTSEAAMTQLEDLTAEMAAEFGRLPDEIGRQPLADLLAARERLARLRRDRLRFDAAIHGATLND